MWKLSLNGDDNETSSDFSYICDESDYYLIRFSSDDDDQQMEEVKTPRPEDQARIFFVFA